ncbi:MAG: UDP-N-acetylmuramate--L-alanine ligase [Angustibacter sp.]
MIPDVDLQAQLPSAGELAPAHFVGVAGAGMSGVARLWLAAGLAVSGSDGQASTVLSGLREAGAQVRVGHRAEQVDGARCLVVSSAVRDDNPEVQRARELGLPVLHRSQALAAIAAGRRIVAVAGTNGKTTTTAMIATVLMACGRDPSYCVGGDLQATGSNAQLGSGDTFVLEADESDGSFVVYRPEVAVVTNVQPDHLDFYGDLAGVEAGFRRFADSVHLDGVLVVCADDDGSARLAAGVAVQGSVHPPELSGESATGGPVTGGPVTGGSGRAVVTYGMTAAADVRGRHPTTTGDGSSVDVLTPDGPAGTARLSVPGMHNVSNALAAVAAVRAVGVPAREAVAAVSRFTGTRRRFEFRGTAKDVRVYDDYAHNPGKVAAAVRAGRQVAGRGRLVVVFQPHLYSRTRDLAAGLGAGLGLADEVVVMDVYASREDPVPGIGGDLVARAVPLPAERVHFVPDRAATAQEVLHRLRPKDVVLTIGAGDVTQVADEVLTLLAAT